MAAAVCRTPGGASRPHRPRQSLPRQRRAPRAPSRRLEKRARPPLRGGRRRRPAAAAAGGAPVNVLVVGGGGREHALCWRLRQSPSCGDLFCAPGNAGIAVEEGVRVVSLDESDHAAVVAFCADHEIGLVVCGPEAPLVDGLADSLIAADVPCFGPTKAAARLEGSKGFLKDLLRKYDIPTARYARFSDPAAAKAYIEEQGAPIVVKTDGLAAGKGVIVAMDTATALSAVDDMMVNAPPAGAEWWWRFGREGELLRRGGRRRRRAAGGRADHKRVGEGDTGLNTGGMGFPRARAHARAGGGDGDHRAAHRGRHGGEGARSRASSSPGS